MFNIFSKKKSLVKSGFFFNFTDCHSHILPGVDDGVRTIEDSLLILEKYEKMGITSVVLTPHIMESFSDNSFESLTSEFEKFKAEYKGNISLRLAAEYMLDNEFESHLKSGKLLTFAKNYILVETSYLMPPMDIDSIMAEIHSEGYFTILAHPERFGYLDMDDLRSMKKNGVILQLNVLSLSGFYGKEVQSRALELLDEDLYSLAGSDLHRLSAFETWSEKIMLSDKRLKKIEKIKRRTAEFLGE